MLKVTSKMLILEMKNKKRLANNVLKKYNLEALSWNFSKLAKTK